MTARVFTIAPSAPFLPALLRALADGRLVDGVSAADPLGFAATTIFLPTRRACRLARDAFLDVLGVEAALLPRMVPIGDIDEDELVFADMASGVAAADALDLPPALGCLERRFLLAQLVNAWAKGLEPGAGEPPLVVRHPSAALALADDLARLIDDMTTREVPWQRLDKVVPDHLDQYWQITLKFLQIARDVWPAILAERGAIEPADRRDRLIAAEARRLAASQAPVVAAGSTGSMPATARLLATIAHLPRGAVVLPGSIPSSTMPRGISSAAAPIQPGRRPSLAIRNSPCTAFSRVSASRETTCCPSCRRRGMAASSCSAKRYARPRRPIDGVRASPPPMRPARWRGRSIPSP